MKIQDLERELGRTKSTRTCEPCQKPPSQYICILEREDGTVGRYKVMEDGKLVLMEEW